MRKPALTDAVISSLERLVEIATENRCLDASLAVKWVADTARWKREAKAPTYEAKARAYAKAGEQIAALKTIRAATGQSLNEARKTLTRLKAT